MSASRTTDRVSYLIARTNRLIEEDLARRLQPEGLSVEQFRVLRSLEQHGPQAMGELAAKVLVEPATLTKIIDRMVSDMLVFRLADPSDRRKVKVALAPAAARLCETLQGIASTHEQHVEDMFFPGRMGALRQMLLDIPQA